MRWPWNERRDRERDLTEFVWWLANEKSVYLGRHVESVYSSGSSPFAMERLGTHSFDAESRLVDEYLEGFR